MKGKRRKANSDRPGTMPRIVAIVGSSGSGKTTLILKLIKCFTEKGLSVGTMKHMHHEFEMDVKGKDSYRQFEAGAQASMLVGKDRIGFVKRENNGDAGKLAAEYFSDVDILIVEGFKNDPTPKIEVHRAETGKAPLYEKLMNVLAVATDREIPGIPCLDLNRPDVIAEFILKKMGLS